MKYISFKQNGKFGIKKGEIIVVPPTHLTEKSAFKELIYFKKKSNDKKRIFL